MSMWRDSERRLNNDKEDLNKSDLSDSEDHEAPKANNASSQDKTTSEPTQAQPIRRTIDLDDDDMWADVDDVLESLENAKAPQTKESPLNEPLTKPLSVDDDDLEDWFKADNEPDNNMDIDGEVPDKAPPSRFLSPPTADNWDDDLFA
jgi:hypothetical protein